MAMAQLQNLVDLLNPGLWALRAHAPATMVDAKLTEHRDYLHDKTSVFLDIRHCIYERFGHEQERLNGHLIGERMKKALMVEKIPAKAIAVERRRLHWRGLQQRKDKPHRRATPRRRAA